MSGSSSKSVVEFHFFSGQKALRREEIGLWLEGHHPVPFLRLFQLPGPAPTCPLTFLTPAVFLPLGVPAPWLSAGGLPSGRECGFEPPQEARPFLNAATDDSYFRLAGLHQSGQLLCQEIRQLCVVSSPAKGLIGLLPSFRVFELFILRILPRDLMCFFLRLLKVKRLATIASHRSRNPWQAKPGRRRSRRRDQGADHSSQMLPSGSLT